MRLTESDLHNIIESAVRKILKERVFSSEECDALDGLTNPFNEAVKHAVRSTISEMIDEEAGAGGGGATNAAGVMQGGGTNPEVGQYVVPFGTVQRKKGYSPKGDAKGDVTKQTTNVDMSPALKRKDGKGGSISIPKNRK